ncbi:MAG TPA: FAD-dependent oxidoreductase, partial [Thermoanaerobaculia bacterium]|nr:FAD-dependent oxidoreductase [Thermoanaerobaculia bacterium]
TAAYRLLQAGFDCRVFEARPVIGGRSLTLRHGDVLVERPPRPYVDDGRPSSEQRCVFQPSDAHGFDRPYLNAGPGRIPSAHTHVLDLCRELGVPLEVYVMESRSNLVRSGGRSLVNRHVANDARGWIAQALFERADSMPLSPARREALRGLLIQFGALGNGQTGQRGVYALAGAYQRSDRAGYRELPGVEPGEPVSPLALAEILDTRFWERPFYQPEDFLWQPTLFQPVGGMDRIVHALADAVGRGRVRTGVAATAIRRDGGRWRIALSDGTVQHADVCVSNVPLPLLRGPLGDLDAQPFDPTLRSALRTVFSLPPTGVDGFLAPTTKVGWQARRALWQQPDPAAGRVVPIYGGISWTEHPMTQLWYPSDRVHDDLGVLTGAYNFRGDATAWGERSPGWRLASARQGAAELAGTAFAAGLGAGLAIAWQNVEHLRGGWAQWQNVPNGVEVYGRLARGDQRSHFYFCGDQLSQLPGWQEGAVASALHTVAQIAVAGYEMPAVDEVPDSRLMVEGMMPVEPE